MCGMYNNNGIKPTCDGEAVVKCDEDKLDSVETNEEN
jgi:hypothetical protein